MLFLDHIPLIKCYRIPAVIFVIINAESVAEYVIVDSFFSDLFVNAVACKIHFIEPREAFGHLLDALFVPLSVFGGIYACDLISVTVFDKVEASRKSPAAD